MGGADYHAAMGKSWPAQQGTLVQSRTAGESVLARNREPTYHCCAQSWAGVACKVGGLCLETEADSLDSCSRKWSAACSPVQGLSGREI